MLARMFDGSETFARLHDDMNRMLGSFWQDAPAVPAIARPYSGTYPALNAWESGDAAWIETELPGLSMDDIEVLVSGKEVTIRGERKIGGAQPQQSQQSQQQMWLRRERGQGAFTRTVTFPWEIDADQVEAKLRDGVLTVQLPKAESHRPKKIKVIG